MAGPHHHRESMGWPTLAVEGGAVKYRKKPVQVEAVRWDGSDADQLPHDFVQWLFGATQHKGIVRWGPGAEPDKRLSLFNTAEQQWLTIPVGHWIIRGVQGELYPCSPDIFDATYDAVPSDETTDAVSAPFHDDESTEAR